MKKPCGKKKRYSGPLYPLFFEDAQGFYLILCLQARVKVEDNARQAKLILQKKSTELEVALATVLKKKRDTISCRGTWLRF